MADSNADEALLQHSKISAMVKPDAYNMGQLRGWLMDPDGADGHVGGRTGVVETYGDVRETKIAGSIWTQLRTVATALLFARSASVRNRDLVATCPEVMIDGLSR